MTLLYVWILIFGVGGMVQKSRISVSIAGALTFIAWFVNFANHAAGIN